MTFSPGLCILSLLWPMTLLADSSDAVNERLPYAREELEAHWQVDCAANWRALQKLASRFTPGLVSCETTAELRRALQLCAFIYQPPGEPVDNACIDYRSSLQAAETRDCGKLAFLAKTPVECAE
jgi:hypothetical protein